MIIKLFNRVVSTAYPKSTTIDFDKASDDLVNTVLDKGNQSFRKRNSR